MKDDAVLTTFVIKLISEIEIVTEEYVWLSHVTEPLLIRLVESLERDWQTGVKQMGCPATTAQSQPRTAKSAIVDILALMQACIDTPK